MLTPDAFWQKLDAAADHMLGFDNGVYDLARARFIRADEIDPDKYFVSMSSVLGDYASMLKYTTRGRETGGPDISSGRKERALALKTLERDLIDSNAYVINCDSTFDHAVTRDNPAKRLYKRRPHDFIERFASERKMALMHLFIREWQKLKAAEFKLP
ncbi:hypothetical protein CYMTET_12568 [Cymbomonas tetramitiformis]|uniref:Uncharacterized protein n=1 Tax=Cymbomonas tetramitiformis TaxID=36881 RepID=A0AAE0LBQ5_9CHLO|nr:hypothetical protein CYMTET_17484 [Cymbomonas tetramitiformis]KAK3279556.1 hypothetical protein CYMTET_12568 [Cymbomonas tetramitiformis]